VKENNQGVMRLLPSLLTTAFPRMSGSDWVCVSRLLPCWQQEQCHPIEHKALCRLTTVTKIPRHPPHFMLKNRLGQGLKCYQ